MAEKRRPTYDLGAIQSAFSSPGALVATTSAVRGAADLGMDRSDIVSTIQGLRRTDFYKSMTSHGDHRVWQDVYHARTAHGLVYVKFTAGVVTEFLLLSFKEK